MIATERGKAFALAALADRRAMFANSVVIDNASLPAGAPMIFRCIGCGGPIFVPESYLTKPSTCSECGALIALGWME